MKYSIKVPINVIGHSEINEFLIANNMEYALLPLRSYHRAKMVNNKLQYNKIIKHIKLKPDDALLFKLRFNL